MDNQFFKKLVDFYSISSLGLYVDEKKDFDNYSILYSKSVDDYYYNFALKIDANTEEEFKSIFGEIKKEMIKLGRKPTFSITPLQKYLYNNKERILDNRFKNISKEIWQIFDDFKNIDNIKINCDFKVEIVETSDYKKFGVELFESYKGDENDPYDNLGEGYMLAFKNFNSVSSSLNNIKNTFYFIKINNEIIGTVYTIFNDMFCDIRGLAIKYNYRKKGIGKNVIKQLLNICKEKNKIAFIQTEEGYYPAKLYRDIGFKDVFIEYYYQEKS